MFDWERFSANDGIGEVQVPLWAPNVDLAEETDRFEEMEKITCDKNKKVMSCVRVTLVTVDLTH